MPKSTATQAPSTFAWAATALTSRSAPSSCGLSTRIGIPVFRLGPTIRQALPDVRSAELLPLGAELRHDGRDDRAVEPIRSRGPPAQSRSEIVAASSSAVAFGSGGEAPVARQLRALEGTEVGLRVPDVDREQHRAMDYPATAD